ncbi:hypothetical protein L1987_57698 [Smallanthus sonchifolius]|uniref:Uncharacterized protein n=1 Tax=Smallanthus sonchifolius TaxID=185202 RepID=A0ACB9DE93_9ASTR|nr:hypothetical protein L1987_57698 [Smallanthus sonchifolius]
MEAAAVSRPIVLVSTSSVNESKIHPRVLVVAFDETEHVIAFDETEHMCSPQRGYEYVVGASWVDGDLVEVEAVVLKGLHSHLVHHLIIHALQNLMVKVSLQTYKFVGEDEFAGEDDPGGGGDGRLFLGVGGTGGDGGGGGSAVVVGGADGEVAGEEPGVEF